ncbi:hypothetical protein M426DRAFT_118610 [Hypoxylon sp. CI-4A]|nr:hypothetical protein M426DRAFT_118610 [Hypoxylon sp. CI-4A]
MMEQWERVGFITLLSFSASPVPFILATSIRSVDFILSHPPTPHQMSRSRCRGVVTLRPCQPLSS